MCRCDDDMPEPAIHTFLLLQACSNHLHHLEILDGGPGVTMTAMTLATSEVDTEIRCHANFAVFYCPGCLTEGPKTGRNNVHLPPLLPSPAPFLLLSPILSPCYDVQTCMLIQLGQYGLHL